jgi:hypothetical protein
MCICRYAQLWTAQADAIAKHFVDADRVAKVFVGGSDSTTTTAVTAAAIGNVEEGAHLTIGTFAQPRVSAGAVRQDVRLIEKAEKPAALRQLVPQLGDASKTLVFVNTKKQCAALTTEYDAPFPCCTAFLQPRRRAACFLSSAACRITTTRKQIEISAFLGCKQRLISSETILVAHSTY